MTILAVVAVHLVAVALPGAGNKGIDMRIFLLLLMLCGFQVFAERLPSVTDLTDINDRRTKCFKSTITDSRAAKPLPGGRVGYADNRGQKH